MGPKQETGMGKRITGEGGGEWTIGLDLGDRFTGGRVIDAAGEIVESFRVRTTRWRWRAVCRATRRAGWCWRSVRTRPGSAG